MRRNCLFKDSSEGDSEKAVGGRVAVVMVAVVMNDGGQY